MLQLLIVKNQFLQSLFQSQCRLYDILALLELRRRFNRSHSIGAVKEQKLVC